MRQHEFEGYKNYAAFERTNIYYDAKALKKNAEATNSTGRMRARIDCLN